MYYFIKFKGEDMRKPRLFSIASGVPFLPTLVDALTNGTLLDGHKIDDPLSLANVTIYVPTRRAGRALRAAFVEKNKTTASFLPIIRPLGDVDDDGPLSLLSGEEILEKAPPISTIERQLLLARLIRPWRENLPQHLRQLFGREDITIPANTADAIWFAGDLAKLMDQVETDEADWAGLKDICPDLVAEWWQVTLDFLRIVTASWPEILKERGQSNPAWWRNQMIREHALSLKNNPPKGPVIAAGSTGSIPAAAELLKVIAHLPNGAVVLPGLDRDLDDKSWNSLSDTISDPSIFGNPQYGLNLLLQKIGALRDSVEHIGDISPDKRAREFIVAQAFRPAATTDQWSKLNLKLVEEAFASFSLVETASEREEAVTIAVALRDAIHEPDKTAAFVTGDRNLARRVAAELKRFGIYADDSGGKPLSETEPAALIRLLLDCVFSPGDPVAFLSLLKHPLTRLGKPRHQLRRLVERFELFALRGGTGRISLANCPAFIAERLLKMTELDSHNFDRIDPLLIEEAQSFAGLLMEAAKPLADFAKMEGEVTILQAVEATIASFENFGRDEDGTIEKLYDREAGQGLISFMQELVADRSGLTFQAAEWPEVFAAIGATISVRMLQGGHPRLYIWGALESRLQNVDTMVIGGLNEGVWPGSTRNDPFMSRPMKATIALDPPERSTGIAAHDFQMILGCERVIMTRSVKLDNAPSVPSRWLQRLETVIGQADMIKLRERGAKYLYWARKLDEADDVPFIERPNPKPLLKLRPKHFSVTEVETLRRDPYAIYAKKILRLKPLDPLIRDPSVAERGTLYHAIVASFSEHVPVLDSELMINMLSDIAREEFDKMQLPLDVEAIWWPRFRMLMPQLIAFEQNLSPRKRLPEIKARAVEINGSGISLSGRADRIDMLDDGGAEILDFKTGSTPSIKQAATLMAPQLALEGALLRRGAFSECEKDSAPTDLIYVRLTGKGEVEAQTILKDGDKTAMELSELAWQRLHQLVSLYLDENQGYLSRAMPPLVNYVGDYDHLARIWEWSASGDSSQDTDDLGS